VDHQRQSFVGLGDEGLISSHSQQQTGLVPSDGCCEPEASHTSLAYSTKALHLQAPDTVAKPEVGATVASSLVSLAKPWRTETAQSSFDIASCHPYDLHTTVVRHL